MRFMLPNFRIMQKKDCSFRIYQNLNLPMLTLITYIVFLAITQNWAMRLFVEFCDAWSHLVPCQGYVYPQKPVIKQLQSFVTEINFNFILTKYLLNPDPNVEGSAQGIENVADAVTHTRFVGTDPSSDEVVLMKILQVSLSFSFKKEESMPIVPPPPPQKKKNKK